MSAPGGPIYTNNGYRATDCPVCGQEVHVDRHGDRFRFTCRGGCPEGQLTGLLDPAVMLALAAVPGANPLTGGTGTARYTDRKLDMHALLAQPDEPIPWRCRGVAADGYLTTIAGRGGEGKSWMTLALAHGVHDGRTVAGISCTKGRPVLFDAENGRELLKRRFRAAGIEASSVQPYDADGLHVVKDLGWFRQEVEAESANFVVFDSLRVLSSGADENDTEQVEPIMSALRRLARETGAAIVLVHHRGRDEHSSYRGSSAIRDGTDMLFRFGRVKEDPEARHRRVLETVKCRIDEEPEPRWLKIEPDRAAGLVYLEEAEPWAGGTGGATVRASLADELREELGDESRTRATLARAVGRDPKDGSVGRALEALEQAGRAERAEGGWRRCQVPSHIHVAPGTPDAGTQGSAPPESTPAPPDWAAGAAASFLEEAHEAFPGSREASSTGSSWCPRAGAPVGFTEQDRLDPRRRAQLWKRGVRWVRTPAPAAPDGLDGELPREWYARHGYPELWQALGSEAVDERCRRTLGNGGRCGSSVRLADQSWPYCARHDPRPRCAAEGCKRRARTWPPPASGYCARHERLEREAGAA